MTKYILFGKQKNFRQLSRRIFLFITAIYVNPFVPNTPFLHHLKSSENCKVF